MTPREKYLLKYDLGTLALLVGCIGVSIYGMYTDAVPFLVGVAAVLLFNMSYVRHKLVMIATGKLPNPYLSKQDKGSKEEDVQVG